MTDSMQKLFAIRQTMGNVVRFEPMYRKEYGGVYCQPVQNAPPWGGGRGASSGRGLLRAWPVHMHILHGMTGWAFLQMMYMYAYYSINYRAALHRKTQRQDYVRTSHHHAACQGILLTSGCGTNPNTQVAVWTG